MIMKKNRGKFLTSLLVLQLVLSVLYLYLISTTSYSQNLLKIYTNVPSWSWTATLISIFIDIFSLIGIWLWKKSGVYVYVSAAVLSVLMEVFILRPRYDALGSVFVSLTMTGLLFYAINRKWKYFS